MPDESNIYDGPERRAPDRWRRDVHDRLEEHQERIAILEDHRERQQMSVQLLNQKIDRNTSITEGIDKNTSEMVKLFRDLLGFKAISKSIFLFVVGVSAFIIAVGVIYWWATTGQLPHRG